MDQTDAEVAAMAVLRDRLRYVLSDLAVFVAFDPDSSALVMEENGHRFAVRMEVVPL